MQLRGDLDAICLKALAKTPDGRYVSAAALADDIRRHLNGLPVQAHPPTRAYQIRKFVRRNRRSVTLGTAAGAAVLVALVSATVLGRQAARERDLRQAEAERATAARDFIIGTLASFDPDARPGQLEFSAHDLVLRGQDNLNTLDVQPPLKASVMNTLGQVAFNLGERAIADSLFRAAHDILEANGASTDLAVSKHGIGQVLQHDNDFAGAVDWYRQALTVRRGLGAQAQSIAESQHALAFALYNTEGEANFVVADSLYADLLSLPDTMYAVHAGALEGRGDISLERGQLDRADSLYSASLSMRLRYQSEDHPDYARTSIGLAAVRRLQGRVADAERLSRDVIRKLESTYGSMHRSLVFGYRFLGDALYHQHRYGEAADAFRRAAEISESVNLPGHLETANSWQWAATAHSRQGMRTEALDEWESARDVYRVGMLTAADSVVLGKGLAAIDTSFAILLHEAGRTDEAVGLLHESIEIANDSAIVHRAQEILRHMLGSTSPRARRPREN
jgi:serine/threonine-protein kinase